MRNKSWQVIAVCALLVVAFGQRSSGACAVEAAAERLAGFHPSRSMAVAQAVDLIQRGDYSMALLRLTSEQKDTSMPAQARVLSAYALLVAGNSLGAFPSRS